jgi:hypothetical protein
LAGVGLGHALDYPDNLAANSKTVDEESDADALLNRSIKCADLRMRMSRRMRMRMRMRMRGEPI